MLYFQLLSTRDGAATIDDVETLTLPIEVNVIVATHDPSLNDSVSETTGDSHTPDMQTSDDVLQEISQIPGTVQIVSDVTVTTKTSKLGK